MALCSDAAMVIYYDIAGEHAEHDDWHTYEHMHERLSIPGFVRATRWVAQSGAPKYMAIYEVTGIEVATSAAYLERLNHPTPWTAAMMARFRGMVRGFCSVVASAGVGLGHAAVSLRFMPVQGAESSLTEGLARELLPALASRRGLSGVYLFRPAAPPPMTNEQSIRGPDAPMSWLLLATGYDAQALGRALAEQLEPAMLERHGVAPGIEIGRYALHYTLSAQEALRSAPNPPLQLRDAAGTRR